jgi:teichuronic acid biosynthesis glycosyltransferase TuaC
MHTRRLRPFAGADPSARARGRYGARVLRARVVSNMLATPDHQVRALRDVDGVDVSLHEFPGGAAALARAGPQLRRRYGRGRFDVVHAHYGLSAWPALCVPGRVHALTVHGTDVSHPITRQATRLVLPFVDLVGAASPALVAQIPGARARAGAQALPCGVDVERFRPLSRESARARVGLEPERPYLLFAADPNRPEKRYDRALAVAGNVSLLTLGGVEPEDVPSWINAANAVLVPSDREGFGLAVLEALACDVPVLATPVGIHPEVLHGLAGATCAPFDADIWRQAVAPHLLAPNPRVAGRARAETYSTHRMARLLVDAWRAALTLAQ